MKGDDQVNASLDSRIQRESSWSRKVSHTVQNEQIYNDIQSTDMALTSAKTQAKKSIRAQINEKWHSHIKTLTVQGRFLDLLAEEETSYHWKSFIYNLPYGVCKFLINSVSDTLNTNANLLRWGKRTNDKCKHCQNRETTAHVLSHCSISLEQGRFMWRHDNILRYMYDTICTNLKDPNNTKVTVDLEGLKTTNTTVPMQCTITDMRPDMCIIENSKTLTIVELTVPLETNAATAHNFKTNKYAGMVLDIESNGFQVNLLCIEIGARGYINADNQNRLKSLIKLCSGIKYKDFRNNLCKLASLSSFVIYHAKEDPTWINPPPLSVQK